MTRSESSISMRCDIDLPPTDEIIGRGIGMHWKDLDEDISVEGLLAGTPSGESQESLRTSADS
ncbi:MAG: DUF2442 domain-containing protein [Ignavibacteria bacterium]|nr:DUF2442 domain-containing protein [Ignavibacteria bacterium]